jgi:hypothetical protein
MESAVVLSTRYWIASILLGAVLIGLEFRQRRFWLFPIITLALLVFHPVWTLPSSFGPDCVFVNVETSQVVLAAIALMLGYRLLGQLLTRRQKIAPAVALGIGSAGAAFALALLLAPLGVGLDWQYLLPRYVPSILLIGIATGFLVAAGLSAMSLVRKFARG